MRRVLDGYTAVVAYVQHRFRRENQINYDYLYVVICGVALENSMEIEMGNTPKDQKLSSTVTDEKTAIPSPRDEAAILSILASVFVGQDGRIHIVDSNLASHIELLLQSQSTLNSVFAVGASDAEIGVNMECVTPDYNGPFFNVSINYSCQGGNFDGWATNYSCAGSYFGPITNLTNIAVTVKEMAISSPSLIADGAITPSILASVHVDQDGRIHIADSRLARHLGVLSQSRSTLSGGLEMGASDTEVSTSNEFTESSSGVSTNYSCQGGRYEGASTNHSCEGTYRNGSANASCDHNAFCAPPTPNGGVV